MTIPNGRAGIYGGKKCLFTHYNPKNNFVWSDDVIGWKPKPGNEKKFIQCEGAWVKKEKIKWLKEGETV